MGFMSSIGDTLGNSLQGQVQGMPDPNNPDSLQMANTIGNFAQGLPQGFMPTPQFGPRTGIGMPVERPAPVMGQNPAEQTQQMANNPIYGQSSPFQPPQPVPQPVQQNNMVSGGGKSVGAPSMPFINKPGYVSDTEQPLQGTPMQAPGSVFQGGLRPAPRNFRPPTNRASPRSFLRR